MTKHVFFIIFSIGLLALANPPVTALADNDTDNDTGAVDKVMETGPVVVTATKTEKNVEGVAASVDVITSEEIKLMGATTLKDVIEKTPGLTMQYGRFPHPSSKSKSAISIRGLGANGSLILLNGNMSLSGTAVKKERLASVYIAAHREDRAMEVLEDAISQGPDAKLYFLKGRLLYGQRKFDQAYQAFKKCAGLNTGDGRAYIMMGYCALQQGNMKSAGRAFKKASRFTGQKKEAERMLTQLAAWK